MKRTNVIRDSILIALLLSSLEFLHARLLNDSLTILERMGAYRLGASVSEVLNKAHKANDDLAIYEVTKALEQAPGIIQARIVDPKTKIMLESGHYAYPLKDGAKKWGSLVFAVSGHARKRTLKRQILAGSVATGVVWLALLGCLLFSDKRRAVLQGNIGELEGLLRIEKRRRAASEEREQAVLSQSAACLQLAVERISEPFLILDSHQRVAAINPPAASFLQVKETIAGVSWHEIPLLRSLGTLLEQSLRSPERYIQAVSPLDGSGVVISTLKNGSGTWIELIPSHKE